MGWAAAKESAVAARRLYLADDGDVDQVVRLKEFRAAHPEVEIKKEGRHCWARWETVAGRVKAAYAAELEWSRDGHFPEAAV